MKITELQVYKKLEEMFKQKGYSQGIKDTTPISFWSKVLCVPDNLTAGHYVYSYQHGEIKFQDIPEQYLTREFFLHALSERYEDVIIEYIKAHPSKFDKRFFKDHIATTYSALKSSRNDFDYMPLEFIDEEMVACAMFKSIDTIPVMGRSDADNWFYSVYRRKPEVLTQELYTLAARCFAAKRDGENKFLDITPEEYRTAEFYFALCLGNDTPVMEDIPESILTPSFFAELLFYSTEHIQCFSKEALEKGVLMLGKGFVKWWQIAVMTDGAVIRYIPLNDERINFFLSMYDKDSLEYEYSFKDNYKRYLREKNATSESQNDATALAGMNTVTDCYSMLPIHYINEVPIEYSKKYDREEYLLEIYKKIGIQVLGEANNYYYRVILPENFSIAEVDGNYYLKDSNGKTLIYYYDKGDFFNRKVVVNKIKVNL